MNVGIIGSGTMGSGIAQVAIMLEKMLNENNELIAIFVSSIRTSQNKNK